MYQGKCRFNSYLRSHGLVDRSPPDVVLGRSLLDNSLVKRGSTSLGTRVGSQGTAGGDSGTGLVDKSILIEGSDWRVGNNGDTVIIDVSLVVELLFQLGVLLVRSNTGRVQGSLVNVVGKHCGKVSNGLETRVTVAVLFGAPS
jgi:hypothetical protein